MRITIEDDLAEVRSWYLANRQRPGAEQVAQGAVWMLSRISGQSQADLLHAVAPPPPVVPPPVAPPSAGLAPEPEGPVGFYENVGPILRFGADTPLADLSQPPGAGLAFAVDLEHSGQVVRREASFAELADRAQIADGMSTVADPATLAEVDGLLAQARMQVAAPPRSQ